MPDGRDAVVPPDLNDGHRVSQHRTPPKVAARAREPGADLHPYRAVRRSPDVMDDAYHCEGCEPAERA